MGSSQGQAAADRAKVGVWGGLAVACGLAALGAAMALVVLDRRSMLVGRYHPLWRTVLGCGAGALAAGVISALTRKVRRSPPMLGLGAAVASVLVSHFAVVDPGPPAAVLPVMLEAPVFPNFLPGIKGLRLPLAGVVRLEDQPLKDEDLDARYDAFPHAPVEGAGFNALMLPFRYVDADKAGDAAEANAFAFLMSFALDWAPGSFCNRHAYFIFKRSREQLEGFQQAYHHAPLKDLIDQWGATHAVGGEIVKRADGYTGTLEIFSRTGRTTYRKSFDEPRPYFTLLGDEAADALQFFGYIPSPALREHLAEPRCKQMSSIALLGKAAFAEERSAAEFSLYESILKDDPDFGEVRFWRANQGNWKDRDDRHKASEIGTALNGYLQPAALGEFIAGDCPEAALRARVPAWEDAFNALVGEDHPRCLVRLINEAKARGVSEGALIERSLKLAGRFPNAYDLEHALSLELLRFDGPMDADLAAALGRCGEDSLFEPGTGDRRDVTMDLGDAAHQLGDEAVAISVLKDVEIDVNDRAPGLLVQALFNAGRYAEAFASFQENRAVFVHGHPWETQAAGTAAVAAVFAGRLDVAREIHAQYAKTFADTGMDFVLNAYDDLAAGKMTDVGLEVNPPGRFDWSLWQWTLLLAQVDLLKHQERFRPTFENLFVQMPNERLGWMLEEQYQRAHPIPHPGLRAGLRWFHGDDPWVKNAAWPAVDKDDSSFDFAAVPATFDDLPAIRWPERRRITLQRPFGKHAGTWEVVEAVHRMLARGEFAQARDLSLRFYALSTTLDLRGNRVVANHLIHLVETAQRTQMKL